MDNPIKMDDLRVPLFLETPTCQYPPPPKKKSQAAKRKKKQKKHQT